MTNIDDCLAAFAVGSWADRPANLTPIRRAIDAYLESVAADPTSQAGALRRLFAACDELRLDSRAAIVIQDEIAARAQRLELDYGAPAAQGTGAAIERRG